MISRLREIRFRRNVSQLLLSQRTGICQSTLSKIEHGWSRGTSEQRKRIARFFKVDKNWIFPEEKQIHKKSNERKFKL